MPEPNCYDHMKLDKKQKRIKRHKRIRAKVMGTESLPRVSVFRSNRHLFVQLVDDAKGKTVLSAGDLRNELKGDKKEKASRVGELLAQKALEKGVKKVVFDRGGFKYHGRIKSLADGLRKGGLEF